MLNKSQGMISEGLNERVLSLGIFDISVFQNCRQILFQDFCLRFQQWHKKGRFQKFSNSIFSQIKRHTIVGYKNIRKYCARQPTRRLIVGLRVPNTLIRTVPCGRSDADRTVFHTESCFRQRAYARISFFLPRSPPPPRFTGVSFIVITRFFFLRIQRSFGPERYLCARSRCFIKNKKTIFFLK